jgi:hypothetical protein
MAFLRYARSNVVKPKIYANEWDKIRVASAVKRMDYSLKEQAERILGEPFSPDKYLLTHSTIVCSVDAVNGYDTALGEVTYDGEKINRRYKDYAVTTETDQFINNNMDCWSRGVIEKSYKSFIGAHNFVEHIQVEELSKGKIIDAVLRDVGESLYVDILVATNKKHTELVEQIMSGQMNAMSMGCSVDFTVCTKCGNVAADETEMCRHVKYEKGNVFYDEKGQPHRVAELCGHETENPNGAVTFIEASWVATPAFKGAVARNVLEVPTPFTDKLAKEEVISKKAHQVYALTNEKLAGPFDDMDFGGGGGGGDAGGGDGSGGGDAKAAPAQPSPFDDLQKELQTFLVDKIKNKLIEEFEFKLDKKKKDSELDMTKSSVHENDTIIREAKKTASQKKISKVVKEYTHALDVAIKVAKSDLDAVKNISHVNDHFGIKLPTHLYKLASKLGSANQYGSLDTFLIVANEYSNRPLRDNEKMILIKFAKLLSSKKTK